MSSPMNYPVAPDDEDVSQRLAEQTPLILDRWEARVREELPASRDQDPPALRNDLPVLLLRLAEALAPMSRRKVEHVPAGVSIQHGRERAWVKHYSLAEVIREYSLLREVVLEILERAAPLRSEERELLHRAIDRATEASASEYVRFTQEVLRDAEETYRLLVECARDYAIITLTPDGNIATWNPGAEHIIGYSADEVIGRNVSMIFTPEDRERGASQEELMAAATEGRAEDERWHVRKDGSRFWASGVLVSLREDHQLRGFAKVLRDTTERKRQEEERLLLLALEQRARREAEQTAERLRRLQMITDTALAHLPLDELLQELLSRISQVLTADTAVILLLEGNSLVVRAARGLEEEVERNDRVPLGRGFAGRIASERQSLSVEDVDTIDLHRPVLREKGVRSLLGVPLIVGERVIGVLHVGSLTMRRFAEEDQGLLRLAAERVALAIDHARLVSELRAADHRKDEFLAMLAHEMRTPISAIANATYLLENLELAEDRGLRHLATVSRQTRHLARLAEDLLDVARITQGKLELRKERIDLVQVAREAAQASLPLIESRGQEFVCHLASEPLWVQADAVRLEQVVTNLLNNAAKFTEAGGSISVAVERVEAWALLRVRDTGAGIEPVMLPQIFDLFKQVDPEATRSRGGLGIGLTLVQRLVEMHGGCVKAHSSGPGKGAEFVVQLPLVATDVPS